MSKKILHFCSSSPITKSYIEFVNKYFDSNDHYFIIFETSFKYEYPGNTFSITTKNSKVAYFKLIYLLLKSDKLILHGFFQNSYITRLLTIFPMTIKKTTWVLWGADFYDDIEQLPYTKQLKYRIFFYFKKRILKKIPYYATYLWKDFYLAKSFYKSNAKLIECIMYPSNLYKEDRLITPFKDEKTILLGNSASRTNNHIEILYKLKTQHIGTNYNIICPLSYGDLEYRAEVLAAGYSLFAEKFMPLMDVKESNTYYELISIADIALFNHKRQEGMGTIITLLGMGKKIYLQGETSQWSLFKSLGIVVFNINERFDSLFDFDMDTKQNNIEKISNYFSIQNLINQTFKTFEE